MKQLSVEQCDDMQKSGIHCLFAMTSARQGITAWYIHTYSTQLQVYQRCQSALTEVFPIDAAQSPHSSINKSLGVGIGSSPRAQGSQNLDAGPSRRQLPNESRAAW